jgi:hypothetical protein
MARTMPTAGYYVYQNILSGPDADVTYTTGIAGRGGHKYYRVMGGSTYGWCTLLWSCVPGLKDLAANYTYYPTLPPGIPPF